ncbi:MAG TPA: biosynthetic-type acetolactate synthase large subunit [bacterium]
MKDAEVKAPELTGAQILVESLLREGVDVIFGFPGGSVLNIYDVLYDAKIKHVLTRHEQGAVHAADGYARSTGKPGVVLVTSGPGATNTVTGIATAYMDSIPLVIITGQVPTTLVGNDAFQEADIVGITRPCTKHNFLVKNVKDLARTIKEAFYIASTGRPGPVLIDIPKDITQVKSRFLYPAAANIRSYKPNYQGHPGQIKKAVDAIFESSRPMIFSGGGINLASADADLKRLAEKLRIPVTSSLMGLGGFPGENELFLGMLGMHGTYAANMAIQHSDLIIGVGVRFDDRVTGKVSDFAPEARIIQIDIDPTSIGKSVEVDIPIVGDAKNILKEIVAQVEADKRTKEFRKRVGPWLAQIREWTAKHPLTYGRNSKKIKPQFVVETIYKLTNGKAIISTDVGQHQMWAAQFYKFHKPRKFLTSGGLGTMGYGFPAAIGAQVAFPDELVISISGDGSIQMNIQEVATAVQYNLPVKVVIIDNKFLGMVRQWQEKFYNKRYSYSCLEVMPDFVKLAEAYGAVGIRIDKPEETERKLKDAFSNGKPTLIDVVVEREEGVYPMVPAGAGLKEMIIL